MLQLQLASCHLQHPTLQINMTHPFRCRIILIHWLELLWNYRNHDQHALFVGFRVLNASMRPLNEHDSSSSRVVPKHHLLLRDKLSDKSAYLHRLCSCKPIHMNWTCLANPMATVHGLHVHMGILQY